MRYGALLPFMLLLGCGLFPQTERVKYPVTDETTSLVFVDTPGGWGHASANCSDKPYSNIACPFILKRTIDFTTGVIEEQRCSCFPEIFTQRLFIDGEQRNNLRDRAKRIPTVLDRDMISASDMIFTRMIVRRPDSEKTFLYSLANYKGSGGGGVYVDGRAAQGVSDTIAEQLKVIPSTSERALRKIFTGHQGFFLFHPLTSPQAFPLCQVQSSFLYKAAAQQVEVSLCDPQQGMRFQTLKLDNEENEILLNALRALEAPTVDAASPSCGGNPIHLQLYQADGTPDIYSINGVSCDGDWQARADLRRQIFGPSAEFLLNIVGIYDNF